MTRTKKALLNVKVSLFFSLLMIGVTFFSRKLFIGTLGDDTIGLITIVVNILGFLNLTELGISSAISFLLYKPIHDNDNNALEEIISVMGFYYRRIGLAILGLGIVLSFFLPLIFKSTTVSMYTIYATYYAFLASTLFSYFFNYKQILFIADQKGYLVTTYISALTLSKICLQVLAVYYSKGNFYLYLLLEVAFSALISLMINLKIKREYSWMNSSVANGKEHRVNYPEVVQKGKQLFSHQFAGFILNQTDAIVVFSFTSLSVVTIFSNYMLIIQKLLQLVNDSLSNTSAGVGNIVASRDLDKIKKVFGELSALRYLVTGIIVFCLYKLIPDFIALWLGPKYIMDSTVFFLLLVNMYIMITRQTVQSFLSGYGLFKDIWAPWVEAGLNVGLSVLLGSYMGIKGVILGSTVSLFLIVVCWKPYFLFREGFHDVVKKYWANILFYFLQLLVIGYLVDLLVDVIMRSLHPGTLSTFLLKSICSGILFSIGYVLTMYLTSMSMRSLISRFFTPVIVTKAKNKFNI